MDDVPLIEDKQETGMKEFLIISGIFSGVVAFTYQDEMTVILFIGISIANFIYLIFNYAVWIMPSRLLKMQDDAPTLY